MTAYRYLSWLAFAASLAAGNARAQQPPAKVPVTRAGTYSKFESEAVTEVLGVLGANVDLAPEGKTIEDIVIVPLEVIREREAKALGTYAGKIPVISIAREVRALNALHVTTRSDVIEREMLLVRGDRWQQTLVDETARNLRRLSQLSLVLCVPLTGSAPDKVRLLAITQDVWSLRFNSDVKYGPGGLESLLIQPTESNLFGAHQTVYGRFTMLPLSYSLGAGYVVPRVVGRRLSLVTDANIIINRQTGTPEGSFGSASIARPLYSALTEWAWAVGVSWRDEVIRRYVNAHLSAYDAKLGTPNGRVPYEYRGQRITESAAVTRSFGWATKNDFTTGVELNRRGYHTGDLPGIDPAAVRQFVASRVPVSDTRAGPFVQWHGYKTDFVRVLDFESLGLQEDFRLGHDLWVRAYPVSDAIGSSRSFVGVYAAAQYTVALGDGLARVSAESSTELEAQRISDASVAASARVVTPRLSFGRVVFDSGVLNRYRNYLNGQSFLGGDSRLRGYPSQFFTGKDVFTANAEFRSRPIEILTVQVGGALFYDVGNAFNGFDHLTVHQSWGVGGRVLIPQLDKIVLRGDIGFPIPAGGLPPGVSKVSFFLAFGQAFSVPGLSGGSAGYLGQ